LFCEALPNGQGVDGALIWKMVAATAGGTDLTMVRH
jgi:hypothetical protein